LVPEWLKSGLGPRIVNTAWNWELTSRCDKMTSVTYMMLTSSALFYAYCVIATHVTDMGVIN